MLHATRLQCHPASPCPVVSTLRVDTRTLADGRLQLHYRLEGALDALLIPAVQTAAGFADNLWQHSCFEAFIGCAEASVYREFNFSPGGQWAAYAFTDYRVRDMGWQPDEAPIIQRHDCATGLDLEVTLPASLWRIDPGRAPTLHLGLSAVIETLDHTLSYWALAHPGERPDFHQRAAFTLRLAQN